MSCRAILPRGNGSHAPPRTCRVAASRDPLEPTNIPKSEPFEFWKDQAAARARDVSECVAARIAVLIRIGRLADANAIEDDDDRALQADGPV
jgi:hypothetical protein